MLTRLLTFDLDGTLADTSIDLAKSVNAALKAEGLAPMNTREVLNFVGEGSARLVEQAVQAVGGSPHMVTPVARAFARHYEEHLLDSTRPYPAADRVLRLLAGQYRLAICSNKALRYVLPIVHGLGWSSLFAEVLGGDWGGPKKPDPAGLDEICRRLDVAPSHGWMIGDGLTDVLAGRSAGMTTVAVTFGFRTRAQLEPGRPDFFLNRLEELPALLGTDLPG